MKTCLPAFALVFCATVAPAQDGNAPPRVTGEGEADGAEIILGEVNADDYPQVLILATVLQDGVPLTGLGAEDFRVREDEVDQEPLTVEPQLPPLSVVVALDASGSMSRAMDATREAAKAFVTSLRETDSVQLLRFARTIDTPTVMTSTKAPVLAAIDATAARGDTALYDGLFQSIDLLAERRGRKAVVVLSDGVDDDGAGQPLSVRTIGEVLERAGTVNVPIYAIGLGTEMDEAVLTDIAETTGALYLNAPDASELGEVYALISDQLSGQYAIRYTSNLPADGIERRVGLAALGVQGSKSYTPAGSAAPAPQAAAATGCAPSEAIAAEEPDLVQASDRYDENLISVVDRDAIREEAVERIDAAMPAAPVDLVCLRAALQGANELYDAELVSVVARDNLREALVEPLSETCAQRTGTGGQVECLTFFRDTYDDELISVVTRDNLRELAFDRLVEIQAATGETDDALAFFGGLYNEELISVVARDAAREALLAAERD